MLIIIMCMFMCVRILGGMYAYVCVLMCFDIYVGTLIIIMCMFMCACSEVCVCVCVRILGGMYGYCVRIDVF